MAEEKIFVKGLFAEAKDSNYGGFTRLSVKVDEFTEFIKQYKNEKGYMNINIYKSKDGKPYCVISLPKAKEEQEKRVVKSESVEEVDEDLPF